MSTIRLKLPDDSAVCFDRERGLLTLLRRDGTALSAAALPPKPSASPARPVRAAKTAAAAAVALKPVSHMVWAEKLGHKKSLFGGESWTRRHVRVVAPTRLGYFENDVTTVSRGTISLHPACAVRVVQASDAARKDRFEDSLSAARQGGVGLYSTPIGKPHCVELHVPVSIDALLGAQVLLGEEEEPVKNARSRTYYFSCESLSAAQDLAAALEHNIKVISQGSSSEDALDPVMQLMTSPDTSLEWFQTMLDCRDTVPADVLYERLSTFYDQLTLLGIFSPFG